MMQALMWTHSASSRRSRRTATTKKVDQLVKFARLELQSALDVEPGVWSCGMAVKEEFGAERGLGRHGGVVQKWEGPSE
jgi:hypothetical protein